MKFKIENKKVEHINKCVRFPRELINKINKVTDNKITFSKFVIDACIYALNNLDK